MALVSFFSPRRQIIIVVGLSELLSSLSDPFLILVTHANLTAADWQDGACLREVKRSIFFLLQTAHWWCQGWYIDQEAGNPTLKEECI